jgi:hypothetical protein
LTALLPDLTTILIAELYAPISNGLVTYAGPSGGQFTLDENTGKSFFVDPEKQKNEIEGVIKAKINEQNKRNRRLKDRRSGHAIRRRFRGETGTLPRKRLSQRKYDELVK